MNLGMENETTEFKRSTSELKEGIISLAAMLNKHGEGTLYFGVKNNGDVIGQKELNENTVRDVSRKISEEIKPQIIPVISVEYYKDLKFIKVYAKGDNIPYSAFEKYYSRSYDEDKKLTPEGLRALINRDGEPDFIALKPANNQNLTFETLKNLYTNHGLKINPNTFEKNIGLLTPDGKYNIMAELLADKNDLDIKIVTFDGKTKAVMLKRTEYGGVCLLKAVQSVIDYMNVINETKVKVGGLQRIEEKYFDPDSFKEAWLNACVHNRWIENIPPVICIFDDRIEIDSNGGLPLALTKEDFFLGISKPVNSRLLNIFKALDFIDQTGHGVPMIVDKYGKGAFYISEHTVRVTIPINKNLLETHPSDYNHNESFNDLSETEYLIYSEITKNGKITRDEIESITGISPRQIARVIDKLKNNGYINRVGSNKNGYWKILK